MNDVIILQYHSSISNNNCKITHCITAFLIARIVITIRWTSNSLETYNKTWYFLTNKRHSWWLRMEVNSEVMKSECYSLQWKLPYKKMKKTTMMMLVQDWLSCCASGKAVTNLWKKKGGKHLFNRFLDAWTICG